MFAKERVELIRKHKIKRTLYEINRPKVICEHDGCNIPAEILVHFEDETDSHRNTIFYCLKHAHENGFCISCGEADDNLTHEGLCINCESSVLPLDEGQD